MDMTAPTIPLNEILGRLVVAAEKWVESQVSHKEAEKPSEEQRMLTPKEASRILRRNVQTVMEWCREEKLDAVKIGGNDHNGMGGKWLIPHEAIDAYLNKQRLIHGNKRRSAK